MSITTLIEVSNAVIKYLNAMKEAPKEHDDLLNKLSDLVHWLSIFKAIASNPWLTTMQELPSPLAQLMTLLDDLKKKLGPALNGMKRLLWLIKKESLEDTLKKIERIKFLIIVAV
ncbi:hypothetical protein ARMGADRAFT_1087743 [Armillaria gallica]|uniref:Uncharacterized protein n=1 Tax=Armillaria gallica TaxID=47427 RepID=A0A2H3CUD6_ARMGA|nr:hypothetical protein ARMGADRAFT_1087743 [Armillaria gallica]